MRVLGFVFVFSILVFTFGCSNKSDGIYPDVVAWNDSLYGISVEEISSDKLGQQIGEVKKVVKPMPLKNGDANDTPVGSKLYEIKGEDQRKVIAVEKQEKYFKALFQGPIK